MRKNATKIAALALSLALTVTSVNIPTNASAASVKLNKDKATLYVKGAKTKKTVTLKVSGTSKKVTFTSNKKSVATVNSKGKVTAKKAGKATITAKVGKKSYKCKVTVKKTYKPVTSLTVSPKGTKDKPYEMTVGQTKKIKATVKPAKPTEKGVTYKSSKTSVATVSSKGTITAKKAGSTTITVTTKGATKTKSNKKATIAVKVVNKADDTPTTVPSTTPSDAPSGSPSDAPSDAPSDTPTDAPSDAPTDAPTTLGNITELKATKAAQLTAIFDADLPEGFTVEVTKGTAAIDGKYSVSETAKNTIVFDTTGNMTAGTYTFTVKLGDDAKSAETEVKDSYVAEIKLLNEVALTGQAVGSENETSAAYIYYDVLNQYGESVRTSETIEWTTAPNDKSVDKASGRITVKKDDGFMYGSQIYVTGVHVKSGTSISTSVTVGMAQAVDSIKFAGFLSKSDTTKKISSLPNDFAKNTYYLLYQTLDQNGNPLDVSVEDFTHKNLTFLSDKPLVLGIRTQDENGVAATGRYTVDGEEYAAIAVEPGQYVDQGGEVNITAISNKTGNRTTQNYVIGSKGLLKSLELSAPASVVADGDSRVKIPFTAKDTNGNTITNYETIVRSSNSLRLSAADNTKLVVEEEDDGTAGIYWSDSAAYDPEKSGTYANSNVSNEQVRNIALTTVVTGGESSNMMLEVSDIRYPNAIKSVNLAPDGNDYFAAGMKSELKFVHENGENNIVFNDQYGAELDGKKATAFFKSAQNNHTFGRGSEAGRYAIKVEMTGSTSHIDGITASSAQIIHDNLHVQAVTGAAVTSKQADTVKFSIVKTTNDRDWNEVSRIKTVTYTIVPVKDIQSYTISGLDSRVAIVTDNTDKNRIDPTEVTPETTIGGTLEVKGDNRWFSVQGSFEGKTITLSTDSYGVAGDTETASGSAFDVIVKDGTHPNTTYNISHVASNILIGEDLYDYNTYGTPRKNVRLPFRIQINKEVGTPDIISKAVTVSDEKQKFTSVVFSKGYDTGIKEVTLNPKNTEFNKNIEVKDITPGWHKTHTVTFVPVCKKEWAHSNALVVYATDQYGNKFDADDADSEMKVNIEFTISEIKESDSTEFTHLPSSFKVFSNNTENARIEGAEIGDTFKLTAKIAGTEISNSITIKVGADQNAFIDQDGNGTKKTTDPVAAGTKDVGLREILGYDR